MASKPGKLSCSAGNAQCSVTSSAKGLSSAGASAGVSSAGAAGSAVSVGAVVSSWEGVAVLAQAVNIARTIRAASSSARNFFICVSPFHFYYVIPFCQ